MTNIEHLKAQLRSKRNVDAMKPEDYISTGSTLLNLACSGKTSGGFTKGKYYLVVGDSSSGKTFLTLTCLAEAAKNPNFDGYRLIHDDAENGALFDFRKFFGEKLHNRIEPPRGTKEDPIYSESVEDFYDNLDDAIDAGPCIYIMDSMDVLVPREDTKKYQKQKKVRSGLRKTGNVEKEEPGTYGTAKAKLNSTLLRPAVSKLKKNGSILLIISQTRDNINAMGYDKKTRSGGHALNFYATLSLWSSVKQHIMSKPVRGKQREMGIVSKVRIKKNRQTGRDRSVFVPVYHSFGLDDTGSMVDYLVEEKGWGKGPKGINAKEFEQTLRREDLIKYIENKKSRTALLKKIVKRVWNEIESACIIERKSRYE